MSFGYSVLGFGSDATHVASVSAPSGVVIDDDDGTDNSITIAISGGPTSDAGHGAPFAVSAGQVLTLDCRSNYTGGDAPTSWSWTTTLNNPLGVVASQTNTTSTSQNYQNSVITISGGAGGGQTAELTVNLASTNSGGTGNATGVLIILMAL